MAGLERTSLGARVVLSASGPISPGFVLVEDGVVTEVGALDRGSEPPEFDVLAPGFCDLQVNGIGPIDVATAVGDDWTEIGQLLLAQGVTTWCPTLVTAPESDTRSACSRIATSIKVLPPGNPAIAGAHLEGPFITVTGAHRREYVIGHMGLDWVDRLDPIVRVVTLAPEVPGATTAIPLLCEKGILVSLGHSGCEAETAHEAISLGARLVTHLGNASGVFHQRAPGLFGAALCDDRVAVSVIADLEHVHADTLNLAFKAKGRGGVVLVTDSVATTAATVGPVRLANGPQGAAARLADGTLAGSVLTMDRAITNVVTYADVSLEQAVEAASTTPARLLGLDDRGSIAPGMRADLVALRRSGDDSRVAVESVWLAGRHSWPG